MSTPAQIAANQANSRRSTGPKTPAGKATSARNSLTHGLTAKVLKNLPEEVQEDFYSHRDELLALYQPHNHLEETLLEIYAFALFQHQRAASYEFVAMEQALANPHDIEAKQNWERLIRLVQSKGREATKALKALESARANRMIAAQISEEFDKEVPALTPYLSTCSKAIIAKVVNPYTVSLASLFPVFEPKETAKDVHNK